MSLDLPPVHDDLTFVCALSEPRAAYSDGYRVVPGPARLRLVAP